MVWGVLKTVGGFLASHLFWIKMGAAVAFIGGIAVFYGNCRSNSTALDAAEDKIVELEADAEVYRTRIDNANATIKNMIRQHIEQIRAERKRLITARVEAERVRRQRDLIAEELAVARFNILEAMRDDEEFAEWAVTPIPVAGWDILRNAAEGPAPGN